MMIPIYFLKAEQASQGPHARSGLFQGLSGSSYKVKSLQLVGPLYDTYVETSFRFWYDFHPLLATRY